ncbi:alpha/beta hydrolase [Dermatophilus congolensis]|uniref:Predicted hydrolase of the alpha/beta superfamily n=1 Tax=Dermatophilus congolensis TaxID=1863 RepID=A0AA46BQC8_9MICO|nr:alpha/beta hydrolase-fold protein [Dermatophilus congolensis]MBO3143949.1 hypothetical protein [Dermatophilus congolensis]MBO3152939.1 hypothetical protein [Dermatophilus congolensis]MBO3160049.1 hypothetical protein [Dermatophilus congolensis]MBO3164227.1 hypothetical protein [Dermatophilus congolensis]MBO3177771.1 hypothetical protein [Dermatophilus congolensis]
MNSLMNVSLVSDTAVWVIRIIAIVAFIALIVKWGALARNTIVRVILRVISLVVVTVLAALALAAPINAEYGWYSTIADFFPGSATSNSSSTGASATQALGNNHSSSPLITGARNRPAVNLSPRPTKTNSGAGFQDFTVAGQRSGVTSKVTVWFPKEYFEDPNATFPVIEAFHGIKPAPYAYFNVVQIDKIITDLVAQGKMKPSIVLVPHWAVGGKDNECVNSAAGGNVETWISEDIPAWAYNTFRVTPGRDSFSAYGLSAGGYCASMVSMLHPDVFATGISLGGYWAPLFDQPFVPFKPGSEQWKRYDLINVEKKSAPPVALWTLYGAGDNLALAGTAEFAKAVRPPSSFTETKLSQGGHNTSVWTPHVPASLEWLAEHSPAFKK